MEFPVELKKAVSSSAELRSVESMSVRRYEEPIDKE